MRAKVLIALALALIAVPVHAQNYPARPIKLVVPFAAGGPGDTVARLLAQAMSKGQTVVVENVSGAGGNIGATYVSRAAPDGYTLLFHQLGMAISPFLYSKLEYDPLDFETIGMVAYQANVLITRPNIAPGTFQNFLEFLKTNKDKLSFASTGPGGASDLCAILFKSATGIDIKTVPYDVYTARYNRKHPFNMQNWNGRPTIDEALYPYFHSKGSYKELYNYSNAEVDKLLDDGRKEKDFAKRKQMYGRVQQIIAESGPVVIPYHRPYLAALNKQVQGYEIHPIRWADVRRVWLS